MKEDASYNIKEWLNYKQSQPEAQTHFKSLHFFLFQKLSKLNVSKENMFQKHSIKYYWINFSQSEFDCEVN